MNGSFAVLLVGLAGLVAVAGVVIAVIAVRNSKRQRPPAPTGPVDPFRQVEEDADALRGDPRKLAPGDIVEIRGVSYGVRGSLHFQEGDYRWAEHLLDDAAGTKRWISVEEDPDLELVLWTEVRAATVTPGAPSIDFDGRRYASDESGSARFTAVGTTGLNPNGTIRYHDYCAPDDARLSFESYGGAGWEVGRGERLHRAEVQIYRQSRESS